jgi:hypothetical protein
MTNDPRRPKIIARHFPYEIDMLRYCFQQLNKDTPRERLMNYVLHESFCVHARNLIDFFYDDKINRPTARHFTKSDYEPFGGENPKENPIYGRLNEQINHLSWHRTEDDYDNIGPSERKELYDLIEAEIVRFDGYVNETYRPMWRGPKHFSVIETLESATATSRATIFYGAIWPRSDEPGA